MTAKIPPILLVGFGKMGGAMLAGWREQGLAAAVAVDPALPAAPGPEVTVVADAAAIPPDFAPAAVVLAVKPQNADATLPHYSRYAGSAVILSIMAGRTVAGIQKLLGNDAKIVRAMPNTPAAVRRESPSRLPAPASRPASARSATRCCRRSARSPGSTTKA